LSLLFFWQKQKKSSPTVPISGCHLSQVGKNRLRARIYERSSPRAHPSVLEEVEGYKNNFVFSQDS
jgi:hypothetical protein